MTVISFVKFDKLSINLTLCQYSTDTYKKPPFIKTMALSKKLNLKKLIVKTLLSTHRLSLESQYQ